ncbi:MAG: tetraacyldisaccharide 4'-kinase [Planctomycetes bacterium]|nr:tetraacyldisaccharide 4'-kinase [Planctomycetota bacterium]
MNQDNFRKLISGQKAGLGAALLRLVLGFAAGGYSIAVRGRNFLYSSGWLKAHRADAAVISVGNITVGGTGKTPLVIWLCKEIISDSKFQISNSQCAILTRGYKTRAQETEDYRDEPAILAESCPGVKVIVNPDRVAGAAEAVSKFGAKVLIMDDGFQHRRLARDIDIVTIDATRPFGYGKMLPAGLLREPVASLKRADAIVITRCDQIAETELSQIERKLETINPNVIIARSIHAPTSVKSMDNKEISLEHLKDKKIFAFCGIGNPDAFLNTIKTIGSELVGSKVYNDHHHYTDDCLADIYEQARGLKADLILTTQKDWTKIISDFESSLPLAYIGIEIKFLDGEDKLRGLIEKTLAGKMPKK